MIMRDESTSMRDYDTSIKQRATAFALTVGGMALAIGGAMYLGDNLPTPARVILSVIVAFGAGWFLGSARREKKARIRFRAEVMAFPMRLRFLGGAEGGGE